MKKLIALILLSAAFSVRAISPGEIAAAGLLQGSPALKTGDIPVVVRPGYLSSGGAFTNLATGSELSAVETIAQDALNAALASQKTFFFTTNASPDVAGHKSLSLDLNPLTVTNVFASVTNNQILASWITDANQPGTTRVTAGIRDITVYANVLSALPSVNPAKIAAMLYTTDASGTVITSLEPSSYSVVLTEDTQKIVLNVTVLDTIDVPVTYRRRVDIVANITGALADPTIHILTGDGTFSNYKIPTASIDVPTVADVVAGDAILQGQIDLWTDPAGGITQGVADTRYAPFTTLTGVNLFRGTNAPVFYGTTGAAFTNAVFNAVANDKITLGVGTYDLGAIVWTNPVGQITIEGSGKERTILTANGFYFHHSISTNMTIRKATFEQPESSGNDLFFWRFDNTNYNGCVLEDLNLLGYGTNAYHAYQNAGINTYQENVHSEAYGTVGSHAFVFKGGSNFKIINCSSKSGTSKEGLLLKASGKYPIGGGDVSNGVVQGFRTDGAISIQAANSDSEISNIAIYDTHFTCTDWTRNGFAIGDGSNGGTNNIARNITIDGVSGGNLSSVVYALYVDELHDITVRNSSAIASNIWGESSILNKSNIIISSCSIPDFSQSQDGATTWGHRFGTKDLPSIEAGVISNQVRCAEVVDGTLYAVAKVGYDIGTGNIAVNDPMWITSGTMSGVYNLTGWGTVTDTDVPITGAVIGDFYVAMATTATNQSVAAGTFHVLPGKVAYMLQEAEANYWMSSGEVSSRARSSVSLNAGRYSTYKETWHAWHNSVYGTLFVYDSTNSVNSTYVSALAHVFVKDRAIYCGVFGGPVPNVTWIPSQLSNVELSFDLWSDRKSVRTLKINTLP